MDSVESILNASDDDDQGLNKYVTSRNVADSNSRDSSKDFIGTSPVLDLFGNVTAELPVTNLSSKYEQQSLSASGIGG